MAQPTQSLPNWLSYSTTTLTNTAGEPVQTASELVYLPLTYIGPSIPLGTLFTYGGFASTATILTSPTVLMPVVTTPPSTTAIPPSPLPSAAPTSTVPPSAITPTLMPTPSVTAIPPSATTLTPSPAIPSSTPSVAASSPLTSTSSSLLTSTPSSLPVSASSTITTSSTLIPSSHSSTAQSAAATVSAAPPPTFSTTSSPSRSAIVAIILGAILFTILLLLLFLLCLRWRVSRRRRDPAQHPSEFSFETPALAEFLDVGGSGSRRDRDRTPGEGSPRRSGSETDPFLTSSRGGEAASPSAPEMEQISSTTRLVQKPTPEGPSEAAGVTVLANIGRHARPESGSSSNGSGYGTVLDQHPSGGGPVTVERVSGHIVPPAELLRIENENSKSEHEPAQGQYSPLLPPPRLDPDRLGGGRPHKASQRSLASHLSDADETATLFTARRVRISPQAAMEGRVPSGGSSGLAASLGVGLSALAGLRRLSWFKNVEAPFRRSRPTSSSYSSRPLSDHEVESGRALLGDRLSQLRQSAAFGMNPEERPISGVSAISGNTIYHDAPSSPSHTPELTPLPRALTSSAQVGVSSQSRPMSAADSSLTPFTTDEPEPETTHILDRHSPTQSNVNFSFPAGTDIDILDIPAPPPASPFASSSSSRGSMGNFSIPGLALVPGFRPTSAVLSEGTGGTRMTGGEGIGGTSGDSEGIAIDVLEEEPPEPENGWKEIASGSGGDEVVEEQRRATFGTAQLLHPTDPTTSEQGSLHSHLSPHTHSSGSAPNRSAHASASAGGSASSRPSDMPSVGGHSLAQSGSVSSDVAAREREMGATSPAVSALGPGGGRAVNDHGYLTPYPSPPSSPLAAPQKDTVTSVDSSVTGTTQVSQFGVMPWAGGLDASWNAK